ncbi:hypothetical protein [Novosphingobium indicum]|nr:hypothetical protein [Novosphingobium indicum]
MTTATPPAWLLTLRNLNREIVIVEDVTVPLQDGDCPEYIGDELTLWLRAHGIRARRIDRVRLDVVRFGFENREDAARFRAACGLPAK